MKTNFKAITLRIFELFLFGFALFMVIPPVMSNEGETARLTPALIFGGGAFLSSLCLSLKRGAESWISLIIKLAFYLLLGWMIHERVFGFKQALT